MEVYYFCLHCHSLTNDENEMFSKENIFTFENNKTLISGMCTNCAVDYAKRLINLRYGCEQDEGDE